MAEFRLHAGARFLSITGGGYDDSFALSDLPGLVAQRVREVSQPRLRPVLNASGVVIHTNLGRAPLSRAALEAVHDAAQGYSNLEYDLDQGERGSRHNLVTGLLKRLTGAEDALVANNNAAVVLLILSALGQGREAIISRGQLVEIGGGFRIPDVMRQSGVSLVEVGTTNRTYAADFEAAIAERTALLLRVHASNFLQLGFIHQPSLEELVEVGKRHELAVVDDLGSGSLLDTARFGLAREPMVQSIVAAGMTLVAFSGDKLLGGPQAGIIVGRAAEVARLRRHPLMRAIRPDHRLEGASSPTTSLPLPPASMTSNIVTWPTSAARWAACAEDMTLSSSSSMAWRPPSSSYWSKAPHLIRASMTFVNISSSKGFRSTPRRGPARESGTSWGNAVTTRTGRSERRWLLRSSSRNS